MESISEIKVVTASLRDHFCKYSFEECARSVLISNLWIKNAASPIRHRFFYMVLASIPSVSYKKSEVIISYNDFCVFHKTLCTLQLPFSSVEDYVPDLDWGEIKYPLNDRNYSIFYGCEIETVYDYLQAFEIMHLGFEDDYHNKTGRNPKLELMQCLALQESIIRTIQFQPQEKLQITPGHIETPIEAFWSSSNSALKEYNVSQVATADFIERYSIVIGTSQPFLNSWPELIDDLYAFAGLQFFFISDGRSHIPLLPRNYSAVLFNTWGRILLDQYDVVHPERKKFSVDMSACVSRYVSGRLNEKSIHSLVNLFTPEGEHHELIFSHIFISKSKLILVFLLDPVQSAETVNDQLEELAIKLNEARRVLTKQPIRFNLNLDRVGIQLSDEQTNGELPVEIIVVTPLPTIVPLPISIEPNFPARIFFLEQYLAIIDELGHVDELSDFLDYYDELIGRIPPMLSMLDIFASFKSSFGVIDEGAINFDYILLDPHGGSALRYKTLREFWKKFPSVTFLGHPRTWEISTGETNRIMLSSKAFLGNAFYQSIGHQHVFISSPFDKLSFPQAKLSNFLMECLEDHLSKNAVTLALHGYFSCFDRTNILFFPLSLIKENKNDFSHLAHMINFEGIWFADSAIIGSKEVGIRIVFNDDKVINSFCCSLNQSVEVELLLLIINEVDKRHLDVNMPKLVKDVRQNVNRPSRFRIQHLRKPAAFPENVGTYTPAIKHFKLARKAIAILAQNIALLPGNYEFAEAKAKINGIRDSLINLINYETGKYNFTGSIPFLIARVDALTAEFTQSKMSIIGSLDHEINFIPETRLAEKDTKYRRNYRNCRYLIEKFTQIQPAAIKPINIEGFQFLCALIDWLHVFYDASDALHYSIEPAVLIVKDDYLVEIQYNHGIEIKQKEYAEEIQKMQLGIIGNDKDIVDSPRPPKDFLDELDRSFKEGLGFSLRTMDGLLNLFSQWPYYTECKQELSCYNAEYKEIENVALKEIRGLTTEEFQKVLDFLVLGNGNMLKIIGQSCLAKDLPVWEHRKRHSSYRNRPVIKNGNRYFWGAFSVLGTAQIWVGVSSGTLPFDVGNTLIENIIRKEKQLIEKALEGKVFEIMSRYSKYTERNCFLHKRDSTLGHPVTLGDFDIISFLPFKNAVINIECKHNGPVFCAKDSKRLRDLIFGSGNEGDSHLKHIDIRHSYLELRIKEIFETLRWPFYAAKPPKIVSIYVTRRLFWWMRCPPLNVSLNFVRVDMLADFIERIRE